MLLLSPLGSAVFGQSADASLAVIVNQQWVEVTDYASGPVLVKVMCTPPPGKTLSGFGCSELRVLDKRGWHTVTLTPSQYAHADGPGKGYQWKSQEYTNGDITLEIDGSMSWIGPPPNGCGSANFTETLEPMSENLTVQSLTNESELADIGLVVFQPDHATRAVTVDLADTQDPAGSQPDMGQALVSLNDMGPDGLSEVVWSSQSEEVNLGTGPTYCAMYAMVPAPSSPVAYAPNGSGLELDMDNHSWYSPTAAVHDSALEIADVPEVRTALLSISHTNIDSTQRDLSEVTATAVHLESVTRSDPSVALTTALGAQTDPMEISEMNYAGEYSLFLTGKDDDGLTNKYAGVATDQWFAPTKVTFSVPSGSCMSGREWGGDPFPASDAYAADQYADLGRCLPLPGWPSSEATFYSARYVYGAGPVGGLLEGPSKASALDALFLDRVATYNGHSSYIDIHTGGDGGDPGVADVIGRQGDSSAKFVLLEGCYANADGGPGHPVTFGEALIAKGVDCVIGWIDDCPPDDPGGPRLMELMCAGGLSAQDAYEQVCDEFPGIWKDGSTTALRGVSVFFFGEGF